MKPSDFLNEDNIAAAAAKARANPARNDGGRDAHYHRGYNNKYPKGSHEYNEYHAGYEGEDEGRRGGKQVDESAMSEIDQEIASKLDRAIKMYKAGRVDADQMGAHTVKLAKQLAQKYNIDPSEAQHLINGYFEEALAGSDELDEETVTPQPKAKTVAKTWDQMTPKEKISGVKGRTVFNPETRKYRTVFDVPAQQGVEEAYDHNAPFNAADFQRHMAQLKAREELRKTDSMRALVGDLIDKDREKEALAKRKKPEDDSMSISDPRHPQYSYTQAGHQGVAEGSLNEFAPGSGFGGDDEGSKGPNLAYDDGVAKGFGLSDSATIDQASKINQWGGEHMAHFISGFVAGRRQKIAVDKKQHGIVGRLMKNGRIKQSVAEGSSDDELNSRPGMWRGKNDMSKRMTKKGEPTKAEQDFQGNLKNRIKASNRQGGLTGPKGVLPEEQGVAETFGNRESGITHKGGVVTKTAHGIKHTKTAYDDDQTGSGRKSTGKENRYKHTPILDKEDDLEENYNAEYDDEAGSVKTSLHTIARAAQGLIDSIDDNENLPEWTQEKIAKVEGMLTSVWDYLVSQKEQGIEEDCWSGYKQIGMKDKAGKKVPNCVPVKESSILQGLKKA